MTDYYTLVREKRSWYPEWLWRWTHKLALIHPFQWIMTKKAEVPHD